DPYSSVDGLLLVAIGAATLLDSDGVERERESDRGVSSQKASLLSLSSAMLSLIGTHSASVPAHCYDIYSEMVGSDRKHDTSDSGCVTDTDRVIKATGVPLDTYHALSGQAWGEKRALGDIERDSLPRLSVDAIEGMARDLVKVSESMEVFFG
ncbi:hypothetical protein KIPB_008521, partial [Kipferlia bialata]